MSADDKAKLRFELANSNFQSIGRAQGLYLSALLTYLCLVSLFLSANAQGVTLRLIWLDLPIDRISRVTPLVTMVLTLAVAGTLNAAALAWAELQQAENELLGSQSRTFFEIDTHKNIVDYIARLQLWPLGKTRKPTDDTGAEPIWRRFHHLLFPAIFAWSLLTSHRSVHELTRLGSVSRAILIYAYTCFALQTAYSLRPLWRFLCRFLGMRTHEVYH